MTLRRRTIRAWTLVHRWSSLVCTLFLLMLCLTGLPLIFHDEIDAATGHLPPAAGPASSGEAPGLRPLDAMLAEALARRPGEVPLYMAFDNDRSLMTITTGPRPDAPAATMTMQTVDRMTGAQVAQDGEADGGVVAFLLQLHTDMFLGLPGMLFLGGMGALFVVAIVSGVVLYAPFMRKLDFGTVRVSRSRRTAWLDYHNLLGIAGLAWMTVVGVTGIVNALATPITQAWQANELTDMTRAYAGRAALPPARYGSLDGAMRAARARLPGMNPQFIAFPGGAFSSRHHYAVFFQGATPFTERVLTPVLIDAETLRVTDVRRMPWYGVALAFSRPLHFGDYGGLPMKLLWAVLDLFTIVVLGSGVYLWLRHRRPAAAAPPAYAALAALPAE